MNPPLNSPLNSPTNGQPLNPFPQLRNTRRPRRRIRPSPAPSRTARGVLCAAALLLIPLVVLVGSDAFRAALDFTTGVLSLVSLTASVVWGLVASDRLFLTSRQRLLSQGVHRATAVASIGFLLLHVTVKLALDHVSVVGALIPFGLGVTGSAGLIGLGSLAGLLMVTTGVTGALRKAFASPAQIASRWRALHMLAYPAWCSALIHGLYAGFYSRRPTWWSCTACAWSPWAVRSPCARRRDRSSARSPPASSRSSTVTAGLRAPAAGTSPNPRCPAAPAAPRRPAPAST